MLAKLMILPSAVTNADTDDEDGLKPDDVMSNAPIKVEEHTDDTYDAKSTGKAEDMRGDAELSGDADGAQQTASVKREGNAVVTNEREAKRPKLMVVKEDNTHNDNVDFAEGAGGGGMGNNVVWFLYTGQPYLEIPRDVTHVRIDPSVKVIDASAFRDCDKLIEVELCEGLELIGEHAFWGCKSLKCMAIPSSVKVIGKHAFHGCHQLVQVEFYEGLEKIEHSAFNECKSLKFIKVPATVRVIGGSAFQRCDQLVEVELCEGLRTLFTSALQGCKSLKRIKVPSSIKGIEASTFRDCEQLEEVHLCEGLAKIGANAFRNCNSLKRVKVPSSANVIGKWAFLKCEQLVEVELCEGLAQIGDGAFYMCKSLKRFKVPSTVMRMPSTLTVIGGDAFPSERVCSVQTFVRVVCSL